MGSNRLPLPLVLALALAAGCGAAGSAGVAPTPADARSAAFAPPRAHVPRDAAIDVEHYALELELFPAERALRGLCRVRFQAVAALLERVELDLVGLQVLDVRDVDGALLAHEQQNGVLSVLLAEPLEAGQAGELAIRYAGRPARGLWFARPREGVPTQAFTHGQCEDARGWFPCWDEPADRATSELAVILPAGWTSAAAGERIERRELGGGRARELWRMRDPHPTYLATLVAGALAEHSEVWRGVPLRYLYAPELAPWAPQPLGVTPQVLESLEALTGRSYPFAQYTQACVAGFPQGGMENVSSTTLTETLLGDERARRDYDATSLIAHEAAHQWFGDLLTCRAWPEVWLNEGFATYFDLLHCERSAGADAFRARMRDTQEAYLALDVGAARRPMLHATCREPLDLFFTGHAYPGGAARLHLLRFVVGDEAFFAGIRQYVGAHANSAVTTADLRDAMERATGADLGWFFRQWFEQPGFPELEVRWEWAEALGKVRVHVAQVQSFADGTPAVFRGPVAINLRGAGAPTTARVELSLRKQTFELDAAERPRSVAFDHLGWWPKRLNAARSVGEWLWMAELDDDVNGRRDAVAVLGRTAIESEDERERGAIGEVLRRRLEEDPSAPVRAAAAQALAGLDCERATPNRTALIGAASGDAAASVRVAALSSLAAVGRDRELARFAAEQFEAGHSYATMGAAARLLVAADAARALAWIEERLALASPHDLLRTELVHALAQLDSDAAWDLLLAAALHPRSAVGPREAALVHLGRKGRNRPRLLQEIGPLLESEEIRLRSAAIHALGQLEDPAAGALLERAWIHSQDPRQRRAIEAYLRRLEARP